MDVKGCLEQYLEDDQIPESLKSQIVIFLSGLASRKESLSQSQENPFSRPS